MNVEQTFIEQVTTALGIAVLHSLWQCALVGTLAALLMLVLRRANTRYMVWCVSMLACMAWMVVTFVGVMWPDGHGADVAGEPGIGRVLPLVLPAALPASNTVMLEIIAWLWAGGFVYFTVRFGQQWCAARRLRTQGIIAVERAWNDLFVELRTGLGVSRRVRLLVSKQADSPMVVGWLSPVVVVPLSAMTMLSPEQVRLVLVHELAHIRRYDHLVNILQVLIETVLFYHPVVWWMSHQARLEREHCCDDAAVRWGGDAVEFARALTELESTRTQTRAVLALNQGGSLMNRITRILGTSDRRRLGGRSLRTLAALTAGALVSGAGIANAALRVEEPRDVQIELVRAKVESGVISEVQAREIFDTVIYPGSELQLKIDSQLDLIRIEIDAAVDAGRITAEQGQDKLDSISDAMYERIEYHFRMSVLGMTESEMKLWTMSVELREMVESGKTTQQEADAKLARVKRGLEIAAEGEAYIKNLAMDIKAQVEAGVMTPEEGQVRMEDARRGIEMRLKLIEIESRNEGHMKKINLDIQKQVEAGVITPEAGRKKLEAEMRRLEIENRMKQKGVDAQFDGHLRKVRSEIDKQVEAGVITPEEGREQFSEAMREIEMRIKVVEVERRIENAVREGKMTREEAEAKILEIRAEFGLNMDADAREKDEFDWNRFERQVEAAVERGDLTREEADRKYEETKLRLLVSPEGTPVSAEEKAAPQQIKVKPIGTEVKLTPMNEVYFLHQGIRPLSAYDESFEDDC